MSNYEPLTQDREVSFCEKFDKLTIHGGPKGHGNQAIPTAGAPVVSQPCPQNVTMRPRGKGSFREKERVPEQPKEDPVAPQTPQHKELKEQNIIDGGKVLSSNFNKNYFTKIDIRKDKEIKLYSKSAKLLTAHPASSYTLTRDANKQYVLRITNPQIFWSTSKYLVIQVR